MRTVKGRTHPALTLGLALLTALASGGCTFWYSHGGEPLTRDELGDWAGIQTVAKPTEEQLNRLRHRDDWAPITLVGGFSMVGDAFPLYLQMPAGPYNIPATPAPAHEVRVDFPTWMHLVPSARYGVYLYVPLPSRSDPTAHRTYTAAERDWGAGLILLDLLFRGSHANVYDEASGERVAAESSTVILGWGLGYNRVRRVMPVDANARPGLGAFGLLPPAQSEVLYEVRDGTSLLFGLVGWGRVNRKRYVQILWIPLSAGDA